MDAVTSFSFDADEPLGLVRKAIPAPQACADLRAFRFEFASRGDRVPGRLLLPPDGDGPFPLVLLQHGADGSAEAPYLEAGAGPWSRRGAAVASIDFPLYGQRASTKLTELLLCGLHSSSGAGEDAEILVREFVHQAVVDLHRALDGLQQQPEIDSERMAYAGLGVGAIVGAAFYGLDPRPQAALAFFEDGGEPKEMLWFEGTHSKLPGEALDAMWRFLSRHLGVT
jgi:cephalosporin-C deacetylase-like acetyl esterase